jgi:hypothetical protein
MLDLKELFNTSKGFFIEGFEFQESDTNITGVPGKLFYTMVGENDSASSGVAIELDADGQIRVYSLADTTLIEHESHPWSYERLVKVVQRYEQKTHDVRGKEE